MPKLNEFLLIEATAKKDRNPQVRGLAYNGGLIKLGGWDLPVVVDLAGLELPASVPLLANHENSTAAKVGQVAAHVEGAVLTIKGEITSGSAAAKEIVEQAERGADWQLSIGANVLAHEAVRRGQRQINGQQFAAPFYSYNQGAII